MTGFDLTQFGPALLLRPLRPVQRRLRLTLLRGNVKLQPLARGRILIEGPVAARGD